MERKEITFTHNQYRKAKVAHLVSDPSSEEFYYRGRRITKEVADAITKEYMENMKNKVSKK